jgi:hypothetical protein
MNPLANMELREPVCNPQASQPRDQIAFGGGQKPTKPLDVSELAIGK